MPHAPRHHHQQTFFVAIALAALLIAPMTFVYKAFAQVAANTVPLAAAISSPTTGQILTSGSVTVVANVVGATPDTTVTFNVTGPGPTRTLVGSGSVSSAISTTAVAYTASLSLTSADNGTFQVTAVATDAPTQRTAQTGTVPFTVAIPVAAVTTAPSVTTTTPTPTLAISAPSTVTGPFQLGARASASVDSVEFDFSPTGGSGTAVEYPASTTDNGLTWIASVDAFHLPPNGTYDVRAAAIVDGSRIESVPNTVSVTGSSTTSGTTGTGTTTGTSATGTTSGTSFVILRTVPASGATFTSAPIPLQLAVDQPVAQVSARITSSASTFSAVTITSFTPSSDGLVWTSSWPATGVADGTYTAVFSAVKDGVEKTQTAVFTLQHPVANTTTSAASALAATWIAPTALETTVIGTTELRLQTSGDPDVAGFVIRGGPSAIEQYLAAAAVGSGAYLLQWDSTTVLNGTYAVTGMIKKSTLTVSTTDARSLVVKNGVAAIPTIDTTTDAAAVPVVQPYTTSFTSPTAGSTVSGTVTIVIKTSLVSKAVQGYVSGASSSASTITTRLSPTYDKDHDLWVASWKSDGVNAGDYRISVVATGTDGRTSDAVIVVKVPAATPTTDATKPAETTTATDTTKTTEAVPAILVKLVEPLGTTVTGPLKLVAFADGSPDSVGFLIRSTAPGSTEIARKASSLGSGRWGASISAGTLAAGSYVMVAVATKGDATVRSAPGEFTVAAAEQTSTIDQKPAADQSLEVALVSPDGGVVHGVARFAAKTNVIAQSLRFVVLKNDGASEAASFDAAYQQDGGLWVAIWNSTGVPDGTYRVAASAVRGAENKTTATVTVTVMNAAQNAATTAPLQTEVPVEAVKKAVLEVPTGTTPLSVTSAADAPKQEAVDAAAKTIAAECVKRGIAPEKCQDWLAGQGPAQECRAVGISTKEECLNWLRKQSGGALPDCKGLSDERCAEAEARKTAGLLSDAQLQRIDTAVTEHLNTVITLRNDATTKRVEATSVSAPGTAIGSDFTDVIPLRPTEQKPLALRVQASPSYSQTSETESARRVPAVLLIDADQDGLPDDVEKRLGTDPLNPDTDGDGFEDGMEIKNGYNPLGPGKIKQDAAPIAPIDAAIVAGLPLEQPTAFGTVSKDMSVDSVTTPKDVTAMHFEGKGTPGEVVSIFVYSYLPVVLSTTVGEDGNWSYDLDDKLSDGKHEAYVTVTDSTGQIQKKSNPLAFFVAEAKAASPDEYFGANADLVEVAQAPVTNLYRYYAIGAAALVLIGAVLGVLVFRQPKRNDLME